MIPLAPIVGVGVRAVATVVLSVTLAHPIALADADLLPGHRVTVWWDEVCDCRRVEYERLDAGTDEAPALVEAP